MLRYEEGSTVHKIAPGFIQKRNGNFEKWDSIKIEKAITKAFVSVNGKTNPQDINTIKKITQNVGIKVSKEKIAYQEDVQNIVEKTMMEHGFFDSAKAFIIHRENRRKDRDIKKSFVNIHETIDTYMDKSDWRSSENANMGHSFQGLMLHMSGSIQAKYSLEKYPQEIRDAHMQGFFHVHDLSFGLTGYCAGWSLRDLLLEGLVLDSSCSSGPAKHFDSALMQIVNFLGTLQNEWAGAQAFNNLDTYLAPFIYYDNLSYHDIKQCIQRFIFNLNTTSRWGGQTPFTNITFDLIPPKHIENEGVIIGGKAQDHCYADFKKEMEMFNKAFLEVMFKGDYHNRIFTFPIPTYNITEDFPWKSEVGQLLLKLTAKYGVPYFQNFINSDLRPEDVRSMCCRLQMDLRELKKKTGGLFGAGDLTGSIGVVTLNLSKYAYLSNSLDEFLEHVEKYAYFAKESLEIKRKILETNLANNIYPFSKQYLKNGFNGHFSTIGLIGGNEACLNLLGKDIKSDEGIKLMQSVLGKLKNMMEMFQEETGNMYNLEATPGEGTAYRLAKIDKKMHKDIVTSGDDETPYYTNSTNLPSDATSDIFEALENQNKLQPLYTGGTVFHIYLGEAVADPNAIKSLLTKAMSKTKIPYVSVTPTFSVCKNHGYISGEVYSCPQCGDETEVYTRVVGYYRPVQKFNKGKKKEYFQRKNYVSPEKKSDSEDCG